MATAQELARKSRMSRLSGRPLPALCLGLQFPVGGLGARERACPPQQEGHPLGQEKMEASQSPVGTQSWGLKVPFPGSVASSQQKVWVPFLGRDRASWTPTWVPLVGAS